MKLIRRATEADLPWLMEQVFSFLQTHKVPHDPQYMPTFVRELVLNPQHLVLVAEEDGVQMGMLLASTVPALFDPKRRVMFEIGWWVSPAHRRSGVGVALLEAFTDWGKQNADFVTMSLMSDSPIDPSSLTKRGYKARETAWVMETR